MVIVYITYSNFEKNSFFGDGNSYRRFKNIIKYFTLRVNLKFENELRHSIDTPNATNYIKHDTNEQSIRHPIKIYLFNWRELFTL